MSDSQRPTRSELRAERDQLANSHPAGHNRARRNAERIAAIDAELSATYSFGQQSNSYFNGRDLVVTRDRDDAKVIVNVKDGMWAVNVKDQSTYRDLSPEARLAVENLPEALVQATEDRAREQFWHDAELLGEEWGYANVYSAGRSSGWCCVSDSTNWESASPMDVVEDEADTVTEWIEFCFAIRDAIPQAREFFIEEIVRLHRELQVELSKYADWVGAEIRGLDGDIDKVAKLELFNGRPALRTEVGWFAFANEARLVRKANGDVPSRLTADPIMEQVFQIIEARGEVSKEQLDAWLDADDENDPIVLYENHIAVAINEVEDRIQGRSD